MRLGFRRNLSRSCKHTCSSPVYGTARSGSPHRFALITSSSLADAQRNQLSSRGAAVVLAAPGSDLDGWLRKGRASAAIVRPDRAVMQAGRSVEAICRAMPVFHRVESASDHVGHRSM